MITIAGDAKCVPRLSSPFGEGKCRDPVPGSCAHGRESSVILGPGVGSR